MEIQEHLFIFDFDPRRLSLGQAYMIANATRARILVEKDLGYLRIDPQTFCYREGSVVLRLLPLRS